jgi:hypothetical protein
MLLRLVEAIRAGGTLESGVLAQRLGASPELVQAMLEHLKRSGYISDYAGCKDACAGCGIRDVCSKSGQNKPRIWKTAGTDQDPFNPG